MADILFISKAGSFAFTYNTATGSIMNGVNNLDGNYLTEDIQDYYNCSEIECGNKGSQIFNCDDVVKQQFEYSRTNYDPFVVVKDSSGIAVMLIMAADMVVDTTIYLFEIDFSLLDCGQCYQIEIWSMRGAAPIVNLFTDGEEGTMENPGAITNMNTGGNNAKSQSNAQAEAGTFSLLIEASAAPSPAPTLADRLISYGATAYNLTTGTIYKAQAYVYVDGIAPFVNGQDIFIDITNSQGHPFVNSFSDAVILSETRYNYGIDGTDAWILINCIFQVQSDTTGTVPICSVKIPENHGLVYVDTITLRPITDYLESISEWISLEENHACSLRIDYGSIPTREHEQFNILYNDTDFDFLNTLRLKLKIFRFNMADPDYETDTDSQGITRVIKSTLSKEYLCRVTDCPAWLIEKLPMALKHDEVRVYFGTTYVNMICTTKNFNPIYPDEKLTCFGSLEFILKPKTYNYQNNNCL